GGGAFGHADRAGHAPALQLAGLAGASGAGALFHSGHRSAFPGISLLAADDRRYWRIGNGIVTGAPADPVARESRITSRVSGNRRRSAGPRPTLRRPPPGNLRRVPTRWSKVAQPIGPWPTRRAAPPRIRVRVEADNATTTPAPVAGWSAWVARRFRFPE